MPVAAQTVPKYLVMFLAFYLSLKIKIFMLPDPTDPISAWMRIFSYQLASDVDCSFSFLYITSGSTMAILFLLLLDIRVVGEYSPM